MSFGSDKWAPWVINEEEVRMVSWGFGSRSDDEHRLCPFSRLHGSVV
jgi:hypothetical protein